MRIREAVVLEAKIMAAKCRVFLLGIKAKAYKLILDIIKK